MDKEILQAILEMVKTGGFYGVWGIIGYWFMQLLTVISKGVILWVVISTISSLIKHCFDNYTKTKATTYRIISEEATQAFSNAFQEMAKASTDLMKEYKTQLKTLNESQKQNQIIGEIDMRLFICCTIAMVLNHFNIEPDGAFLFSVALGILMAVLQDVKEIIK